MVLKLSDLSQRPDFRIGPLAISSARRQIDGPAGQVHVEPLIMQVFLLLIDARGRVVTRTELFDQVWGGVMVGDDSLNRAVAQVRRIASETAPGLIEIETIPRTGYRLVGDLVGLESVIESPVGDDFHLSRRSLVAGSAAVAAATAAGSAWWITTNRDDPRASALVERAEQVMSAETRKSKEEGAKLLREAVRLDPASARAWGLLALASRDVAEAADPADVSRAVLNAEAAARRALSIDSKEANARTALATVRPEFGNWAETEDALRAILLDSPDSVPTLSYLVMILQAVGRARESWDLNERALALHPLSPVLLFRRALKLWILGRLPEADVAADRALQLWPKHSAVWNARLNIFAFTGRAHAALAALDDRNNRPPAYRRESIDFWRSSLRALQTRSRADVDAAVRVNLEAAPTSPYFATASMMVLSAIGQVDEAFAVAEGTLLREGKLIGTIWAGKNQMAVHDQYWRRTMNLFTPATAPMRADPRFKSLCDGMGMTDYWRERGIPPDPMYKLSFV